MGRERGRVQLAAVAVLILLAGRAAADITTEESASILVFPKVIADGTRDTIIQITNTSNSMVHAHCFYVNGALTFPERDPGPNNPPLWTEIDFDIWLTKQQPTYWLVSEGRLVDPTDDTCSNTEPNYDCPNAGIDPGRVPPVVEDFTGELKCVEVDATGAPLSGNHLKGEATIISLNVCIQTEENGDGTCHISGNECNVNSPEDCENLCEDTPGNACEESDEGCQCSLTGDDCDVPDVACPGITDVAKYNAIGVLGEPSNNGDGVLVLGGTEPEYNACPQTWVLDHLADDATDPVLGEGSEVLTEITVVPCTQNFETQVPTSVTIQFAVTNEYEQTFSASTTVTCWADLALSEINEVFTRDALGSDFAQTHLRPSAGTASGFMVVANEIHAAGEKGTSFCASAAVNLYVEGERTGPDLIVIPSEQLPPEEEP